MKGFRFLVDSKTARICESYSHAKSITIEDAMKLFLGSATYRVLNSADTGVYLEVFEFVYDMFLEEMGEQTNETQHVD